MDRRSIRASGVAGLLTTFARRKDGAVAIWFAVLALPLTILAFALIDVNRAGVEKRHLQDALDAAALMVARSTATTDAQAQTIGAAALAAELNGVGDATLTASSFKIVGTRVVASASGSVVPYISNLWLQGDMNIKAGAEVLRSSTNLEMALVLDITGSMKGSRLTDLKTASKDLIDLVVQDVQTPYYSKVAIVPYSVAVNAGTYAPSARGAVVGTRSINGTSWATGPAVTITGITKANTAVVTAKDHGFSNGDTVYITGVKGMTNVNGNAYVVSNKTTDTFRLKSTNSNNYSKYSSGGTVQKCQAADCDLVISTSTAHGYDAGDTIYFLGLKGLTALNGNTYTIGAVSTTSFSVDGVYGPTAAAWTSSGTSYCTEYRCEYNRFTNAEGNTRMFQLSTCVTERTGTNKYTDTAPGSYPVGSNYPSVGQGNDCPSNSITPLSSDRTTLKDQITNFAAVGSTAGQIGVEWGWYMVSPDWGSLWPSASRPAAYGTKDLLKVVVIMTDGEFNSPYCNGVIAKDAGSGSGNNSDHINCNATNGQGVTQALETCKGMKAKGIIVYTVGLEVASGGDAEKLMKDCATSSSHIYLPSSGAALKDAFAAIGRDITKLRIAK
jgi:Flp pilus assembly protein TadG